MPIVEVNFDDDPANQKMYDAFKKMTMRQFWKKIKGAVKASGDAEEKADFIKLYKSFDMGLGKILDKFDKAFPEEAKMKKHVSELEAIYKNYEKKVDDSEVNQNARMGLSGAIEKLQVETKRRMAWVKKAVK